MATSKSVACLECKKQFDKLLKEIKRSPNHFCSLSCSVSYNNRQKKHSIKRSRIEKLAFNVLKENFKDLEIISNDREEIGIELDIFIPSLRLAFEINGVMHYKPIFGDRYLEYRQEMDRKKKERCEQKEIKLISIDVSGMRTFKYSKAYGYVQKMLEEVKNLKKNQTS
jgi:hypothetical protein